MPPDFSNEIIQSLIDLALDAGEKILEFYKTDIKVREKIDKSLVTEADEKAETIILQGLAKLTPQIPAIGEESYSAGTRHNISKGLFWLVDALDGTKEFLKKDGRGSFTVNIALIQNNLPIFGIVYAPALGRYFSGITLNSFSEEVDIPTKRLNLSKTKNLNIIAVASASHRDQETNNWLISHNIEKTVSIGSSLKFCLVATGEADVYPRFGPTMEWDTAAGDAILRCTSVAPALRIMRIIFLQVVPLTRESSITITLFPFRRLFTGLSFSLTPKSRIACVGSINVLPT